MLKSTSANDLARPPKTDPAQQVIAKLINNLITDTYKYGESIMQYINHWPDMAELTLPEAVSQDLYHQLLEPFDSEAAAREFWNESSTTIIILDPTDNITQLKESDAWNQVNFALTYPEYTLPLSMGYQLSVAIVNDSGAGIYLVVPPELSHLISEVNSHE